MVFYNCCSIPLDSLLDTGDEARIDAQPYDVMRKGEVYGELTVGLFFNPEVIFFSCAHGLIV